MENFIKLNSISRYSHISDDYEIEDKSFLPRVRNSKTGEELKWNKSGKGWNRVCVMQKNGKRTDISSSVISEEYENRHPF